MLRKIKQSMVDSRWSMVKDLSLCLLSAVLLILPFAHGQFWISAWLGLVPLFFSLEGQSKKKAFLFSYLTGVIFWSGTIYWLVHVTLPGTIILILYLALYFGFFGLIISIYHLRPITYDLFFLPSFWVILEYLRSHLLTGFPWALLGYSQYLNLPMIQIADITGVWGVSFLVVMVNIFVYKFMCQGVKVSRCQEGSRGQSEKASSNFINYILPITILVVSLIYGFYKIYHLLPTTYHLSVSVVQGNIPQEQKWDLSARDHIISKHFNLTQLAEKDNPDLVIWPEAALPIIRQEDDAEFSAIKSFVAETRIPLLLGMVNFESGCYYNSAILISEEGKLISQYDKMHLVPFGEYIPLKKIFPFLEVVVPIGDFCPGRDYVIFNAPVNRKLNLPARDKPAASFATLICFEDVFPELSREFARRGAEFLVNITNDAWFKDTAEPYQHLSASVFRAVENRLFLVRSANTGVSCFIDAQGKIIAKVKNASGKGTFVNGYCTGQVSILKKNKTICTCFGDIFIFFCLLLIIAEIIAQPKRRAGSAE